MNTLHAISAATEMGPLGVCHLRRLWSKAISQRLGQMHAFGDEWQTDRMVLDGLGLALEETLQYLFQSGPAYDEFERWILERNHGHLDPHSIERINALVRGSAYPAEVQAWLRKVEEGEPVLTEEDFCFWEEHGYVIVHDAVSSKSCAAAERAVWEFLGMDSDDPSTWYGKPRSHGIMVQYFHHPAFSANRRAPRIHKAFAQLWGSADLWVTTDRVSFNPPEHGPAWQFPGPHLHWDACFEVPFPFGVQGLLYLTETPAQQGAFTCVPGFHHKIEGWLKSLPAGADPQKQDLKSLGPVAIAGKAGDLVIWHHALPHGSSPNRAARPRIVQYINMYPPPRKNFTGAAT